MSDADPVASPRMVADAAKSVKSPRAPTSPKGNVGALGNNFQYANSALRKRTYEYTKNLSSVLNKNTFKIIKVGTKDKFFTNKIRGIKNKFQKT